MPRVLRANYRTSIMPLKLALYSEKKIFHLFCPYHYKWVSVFCLRPLLRKSFKPYNAVRTPWCIQPPVFAAGWIKMPEYSFVVCFETRLFVKESTAKYLHCYMISLLKFSIGIVPPDLDAWKSQLWVSAGYIFICQCSVIACTGRIRDRGQPFICGEPQ